MPHSGFHMVGEQVERMGIKRLKRLLTVDRMRREGLSQGETAERLGISKSGIALDLDLFRRFGEERIRAEIAERSKPAEPSRPGRALKACPYIDPAFDLDPCGNLSPHQYCPLHAPLVTPLSRPACSPRNDGLSFKGARR